MYHLVARALPGTLLFQDWTEGLACWSRIVRFVPAPVSLVIMPDHVHLLHHQEMHARLSMALRAYIRWRNHRRKASGPGIAPVPVGEKLADDQKIQRSIRYVHLNPCRARLVDDPLAWPLSTHRDAVGLAIRPVVARQHDVHEFHRRVSSDPTVSVTGTFLPVAPGQVPTPTSIAAAVSAVTRTPIADLSRRGWARRLYLAAARGLADDSQLAVAAPARCSRWTVYRTKSSMSAEVRMVEQVIDDPRFFALVPGDLRTQWPPWLRDRD